MKLHSPRALAVAATTWHVTSQQRSRHNAMVASTALAQRRNEQREVDEFLAQLDHDRRATPLPVPGRLPTQAVRRSRTA